MEDQNIRSLYATAEKQRSTIESSSSSNTETYRDTLDSAIKSYEQCRQLADRLDLFSDNETIEDVASGDLQWVACHVLRKCNADLFEIPPDQLSDCGTDVTGVRF